MFYEMMEKIIINYGNKRYSKRLTEWPTTRHARASPRSPRRRSSRRRASPTSRASCARARTQHLVSAPTIYATAHPAIRCSARPCRRALDRHQQQEAQAGGDLAGAHEGDRPRAHPPPHRHLRPDSVPGEGARHQGEARPPAPRRPHPRAHRLQRGQEGARGVPPLRHPDGGGAAAHAHGAGAPTSPA